MHRLALHNFQATSDMDPNSSRLDTNTIRARKCRKRERKEKITVSTVIQRELGAKGTDLEYAPEFAPVKTHL